MAPLLSLRGTVGARGDSFRVEVPVLDVMPGEATAIVGPSGSGKSTILDILAGILRPAEPGSFLCRSPDGSLDIGALWYDGDLASLRRYRASMVGYVLQTGGLVPFLSVAENVALPYWRDGASVPQDAMSILSDLEIEHLAARMPRNVSVGERQRVAIARALVHRPPIVLADEPTAALDYEKAETVMALLARIARERGAALVVVTHDPDRAQRHGLKLIACESAGVGLSRLSVREADK
jgi:putative ABC transport system ATP-binding protein